MHYLLSGTGDAVGSTCSTDEAVWMDDDAALLMRVVYNETLHFVIIVSIHLHHISGTDVQVEPE